jgi:hypothetical protein
MEQIVFQPEPINFADVIVTDKEQNQYHLHSQILGLHSTVFHSALSTHDTKPPFSIVMNQPKMALLLFFQLLYTNGGTRILLEDHAFTVWKLCVEYDVDCKAYCIPQVKYFLNHLVSDAEVIIEIINFAYRVCCSELVDFALQFFFRHVCVTPALMKKLDNTLKDEYILKISMFMGKKVMVPHENGLTKAVIVALDDYKATVAIDQQPVQARHLTNIEELKEHMIVFIPDDQCYGEIMRLTSSRCLIQVGDARRWYQRKLVIPHLPFLYRP